MPHDSANMYKYRIKSWGLDKKHKEHKDRAIIHAHARRQGKPTRMRFRGRPVDIKQVQTYFKRKGIEIEDVLGSEADVVSGLICETPVLSSRSQSPEHSASSLIHFEASDVSHLQSLVARGGLSCLESPYSFKQAELLFKNVHEYIISSFGVGQRVKSISNQHCQCAKVNSIEDYTSISYQKMIKHVQVWIMESQQRP